MNYHGMKNEKPKWMPLPMWSQKQYEIARWCDKRNIIISPMGVYKSEKYKVCIAQGDHMNVKCDKNYYLAVDIWDKVSEYQRFYYTKYNEEDNKRHSK